MRAKAKVYIIDRADLMRGTAANALLKTLEEPPAGVVFVLLGRTVAAMLPTIVSRCQVVPFRVTSPDAALQAVLRESGASEREARIALAVAGTPARACDFLNSTSRRQVRRLVVRTIGELARDDSWDVIKSAGEIVAAVKVPLADIKDAQDAAVKESSDFLTSAALKAVEAANKRELTARERSGMMEAIAAAESMLRDVLLTCEGVGAPIVNSDAADAVARISAYASTSGVLAALAACSDAAKHLSRNVSAQLTLEVMLLAIKEAL